MESLRRFISIVGADLLARVRTPRFWLAIGAVAVAAWWCFPPKGAQYMILGLNGQYRGQYSSAWIGMVLSMTSIWLSLIGFYLVRGTLARDIDSRVWQLLVATPLRRHTYLLAKWCSHMLVLALVVAASAAVGLAAQWVRAEDPRIDLVELLKPIVLLQLPSLAVTAMFAVWFDLVPWLRRTAGSVLYFVVWLALLAASAQNIRNAGAGPGLVGDHFGLAVFSHEVRQRAAPQIDQPLAAGFCLACGTTRTAVRTFDWSTWPVAPQVVPGRLFWLLVSALGVMLCAPFLDRAAARSSAGGGEGRAAGSDAGSGLRWLGTVLAPLQRSPFGTLLASEIQLALRQRKWWWWLAVAGAAVVQSIAPRDAAAIAAIAAWVLCLDMYAHAALRESESGTAPLVFSAARAGPQILGARALMLMLLGVVLTLPALLRFAATAPVMAAAMVAVTISIAAWSLALGAATRSPRPFEALACVLAYMGINGAPVLNVAADPRFTVYLHCAALPAAAIVLWTMWPRLALRQAA